MTDPTLDWLRSEMQDARERADRVMADDGSPAEQYMYVAAIVQTDLPAALAVLDEAVDVIDEMVEGLDTGMEPTLPSQETLDRARALRDAHREANDE